MMDRFDGGCMKADFDIIRLQNFIYLQHHKIFPHRLTYVNVKKTYIYMHAHGSSFHKIFPRIFFKHILPLEDEDRGEDMLVINRNQKNPLHLLVRNARDTGIFESGRAFENFTRQVKETCVLNHCTRLTWVSSTIKEKRLQRKLMKTLIKVCNGNM